MEHNHGFGMADYVGPFEQEAQGSSIKLAGMPSKALGVAEKQ